MGRTIEMFWKCSHCQFKPIPGRDMNCPSCGHPKDKSEKYFMPDDTSSAPSIVDPKLLKMAKAGANWECAYCGGHERDLQGQCRSCAGARVDIVDKQSTQPEAITSVYPTSAIGHPEEKPASQPTRQSTLESEYFSRVDVERVDEASLRDTSYRGRLRALWNNTPQNQRRWIFAGSITASVILFIWLMVYLFKFHGVIATVESIYWQHSITLEQKTTYHDSNWRSDMHYGAYNLSCQNRFKKYERCHPHDCNPHNVNYECNPYDCNCRESCTSNENGFASCSTSCSTCYQSCSRTEYDTCWDQCAVYEDYCSYDYDRWHEITTKVMNGSTHETAWPDLKAVGANQRTQSVALYQVDFVWDGDHKKPSKLIRWMISAIMSLANSGARKQIE